MYQKSKELTWMKLFMISMVISAITVCFAAFFPVLYIPAAILCTITGLLSIPAKQWYGAIWFFTAFLWFTMK